MVRNRLIFICLICAMLCVGTLAVAGGIKERMLQRQPVILELKDKGIIGETNAGYLGFVSSAKAGEDVVAAENQDRSAIYNHIAQQQNISADLVGKRRAQQLVERMSPGHFYQNASGAWVKK